MKTAYVATRHYNYEETIVLAVSPDFKALVDFLVDELECWPNTDGSRYDTDTFGFVDSRYEDDMVVIEEVWMV